ncbi:MAG: hypothetical protein HOY71_26095, partial [Nonomuraea sp.]|nr:hypothetical protein [Nonomuraea sp.]
MHAETADVLCLTGWHHDSRAEAPGPFPAGDMHFLRKDGTCGCGRPPAGCEVWTGILRAALSPQADLAGRFDRGQHAWQVLERGTGCARTRSHDGLVTLTYRAVAARAGTRIVVDTTRPPAPQPRPDGLRRFYVHLEREPQP